MGALEGCTAFVDDTRVLPIAARQQLTQLVSRAGDVLEKEGIDCDFYHGGCVMAAARHDIKWVAPEAYSMTSGAWASPRMISTG